MKKKMFGAVLAGVLSLSLLAGCGKNQNSGEAMKDRYSPYVDLGDYIGIQYTPTETEVKDTDVESKLQQWLMGYGEKEQKKTGVAAKGDTVGIDYVGRIDGVEFDGGSTKGAGTEITLGSSGYVDNFDDQIVGHEPGQTFDVKVTFPENYGKEELNGKEAVFETTLNYISGTKYPELTDEFVAEKTEYKTIDEYRKHIREDLIKQTAENDLNTDKETMMKQMMDTSAVKELPEKEMKTRIEKLTNQLKSTAASYGISLDQYLMYMGMSADNLQEQIRNAVLDHIKRKMIVCAIAEKADISVSKKEAEDKIRELLNATGLKDVAALNEQYGYEDEDYYYIIMEEKVLQYLYDNAVNRKADTTETPVELPSEQASTEASSEPTTEATTEAASK